MSNPKTNESDIFVFESSQEKKFEENNPNASPLLSPTSSLPLATATFPMASRSEARSMYLPTISAPNKPNKVNAQDAFKKFLLSVKAKGSTLFTHTAFHGNCLDVCGPFNVPDAKRDQFFNLYTDAFKSNALLSLVEAKPHGKWIFYMDIDTKTDETKSVISDIVVLLNHFLQELFARVFGPENYIFEFQTKSNEQDRFHVYCTSHKIVVNVNNATFLRNEILQFLHSNTHLSFEILDDLIDKNMSSTQGLRMYGSRKDQSDGIYRNPNCEMSTNILQKYSIYVCADTEVTPFKEGVKSNDIHEPIQAKFSGKTDKKQSKKIFEKCQIIADDGDQTINAKTNAKTAVDSFLDVVTALKKRNWVAQASSLTKSKPGSRFVTVHLSNKRTSSPYVCPRTNKHHNSNQGKISFDRCLGIMTLKCSDPICDEGDYPWPTEPMDEASLGNDPLFSLVTRNNGLTNHYDLAKLIAPFARDLVAFDKEKSEWRTFDSKKGTWASVTPTTAGQILRDCLVSRLKILIEKCVEHIKRLPEGAARADTWKLKVKLENAVSKSGKKSFLSDFRPQFEGFLAVTSAQWESHFSGYFPVANVLLHFNTKDGVIYPLQYAPNMFVRQEYQAEMTWVSGDPLHFHEGNESYHGAQMLTKLFSDWWTTDEQKSWLEFFAYGMSRTSFAEKYWVVEGRPGSAKSSVIKLLKTWLGDANVLSRTPSILVQKKGKGVVQKSDDGSGHDSATIACYDKCFVILKEAEPNCFWRQGKLKDMSGDDQSGRDAHCKNTVSWVRSFVIALFSNCVPRPEDPSDTALVRRNQWITTTNVFITDERHKQKVIQLMSPEYAATANFIMANSDVLKSVLSNEGCKSFFLALIANAWHRLVVDQKKTFYCSPSAKVRLEKYWKSVEEDQNSAVAFFNQFVKVKTNSICSKKYLFEAYQNWFQFQKLENAIPGEPVSDLSFYRRFNDHFQHAQGISDVKVTFPVAFSNPPTEDCSRWANQPFEKKRINCYCGVSIEDEVSQFASAKLSTTNSTSSSSKITINDIWNAFEAWRKTSNSIEQRDIELIDWKTFPSRLCSIFPEVKLTYDKDGHINTIDGVFLKDDAI